jgi:hypothetical protein
MAAALPYCDELLAGATMADLLRAIDVVCDEATSMTYRRAARETGATPSGLGSGQLHSVM